MDIIVCIKQVPQSTHVEVDPETGVLKRSGVKGKMNPYDLFAIETALRLKKNENDTVKAVTMGPPQAKSVLEEAVMMGADGGLLVTDRRFAGADVLSTSYTLSQAVKLCGKADLVICGKQTTDGDTAQVGAELSEFLGMDYTANACELKLNDNGLTVTVNRDGKTVVQNMAFPCLISVDGDIATPRLPSYKRGKELGDLSALIRVVSLADFADQEATHYGLNGSPTQVERIFPPEKNTQKEIFEGSGEELTEKLFGILSSKKFI